MNVRIVSILVLLLLASNCFSQGNGKHLQGKVTFTTSNNAYVKFDNTEKISIGDTLQLLRDSVLRPCLVVKNKSTSSCVCNILDGCKVMEGDLIFHPTVLQFNKVDATKELSDVSAKKITNAISYERADSSEYENRIFGRVSVASNSLLSSARSSSHRIMYRFSLSALHINNSKFSIDTYLNYRQNFYAKESRSSLKPNDFNVYNLALRYDATRDFSIVVGRKINANASSIGAIDGLQAEKYFGSFYTGLIVGFRPDIYNYNFNPDLFEYGGYVGLKTNKRKIQSMSTLGLLEQKNNGATDRRYVYFQHSGTIGSNLNVFSSFELDVFNKVNGNSVSDARLTNFYISTGYRISKKVNIYLSYDSRKIILYYETYKTEIEHLLENDEARQGARIRVNVKPFKNTSAGISYSKRYQASSQNKSDNFNGFVTLNRIPIVQGLLSIIYNINTSNYLESRIMTFRHSRLLFKKKLNADFYYRRIQYQYLSSMTNNDFKRTYFQNYFGTNMSYYINKSLTFTILGELNTIISDNNYRVNLSIIKRFSN